MSGPCPCHSGLPYKRCCRPWHDGAPAPTPTALMRSRYAAYALGKVGYVQDTTHPDAQEADRGAWTRSIAAFCRKTRFLGLAILSAEDGADVAYVTFRATLAQGAADASFTERSLFRRVDGRWRYHSGGAPGSGAGPLLEA